jgi:uncharacterized protein YjiS (DUF1127 family)
MPDIAIGRSFSPPLDVAPPARKAGRWRDTLGLSLSRARQRRALAELAARDDYLLDDIGVSRAAAAREAAKPFWR